MTEPDKEKSPTDLSRDEYGSNKTSKDIVALAKSDDGIVEAIKHKNKEIYGIMWHPEREKPFNNLDKSLLKIIFGD